MKTIKQSIITIIICTAVVAGVSLVYSWTGPPYGGVCSDPPCPPGGNVPAPINVGATTQYKSGALGIGGLLQVSSFQLTTGAGLGKVLTSNASGLASWTATSSLGLGGGASGVSQIIAGTNITISPAGGTGAVTINSTGGAGGGWTDDGTVVRLTTSTDNVGIGTASPTTKLYVQGSSGTSGAITVDTSGQSQLEFRKNGVQKWAVVGSGQGDDNFGLYNFTKASVPLYILASNDYVGIGTMSPTAKLEVQNGNVLFGGSLAVRGNVDVDGNVNLGKTITLSPVDSSLVLRPVNVGESTYVPEPPEYVGATAGTDACDSNTDNFFWCSGIAAGAACVDYGRIGGGGPYYKRTITCAVQNGNYTVKNDYNSLKFNDGFGNTKLTLGQDGKLILAGLIQIQGGSPGAGKVLTSDASGLASWATPSSGLGGSGTANYISKWTAGTTLGNSVIYDNGTNVGIGTASPTSKLYVQGSSGTSGAITVDTSGQSQLEFRKNGVQKWAVVGSGQGDDNFGLYNFTKASVPLYILASNDYVGIGTASPNAKLDVYGDIMSDGSNMWIFHTPDDGRTSLYFGRGSNGNIAEWPIEFKAGGGAYFAGNVGIGTVSPGAKLHVVNGNIRVDSGEYQSWGNIVLHPDVDNSGDDVVQFVNSVGGEVMRVNSDGNVGIGTASPGAPLEIYKPAGAPATSGTITTALLRIHPTNTNSILDIGTLSSSPYSGWLQQTDVTNLGATYPLVLNPNGGNVGIGTASPGAKLEIAGQIKITGGSPGAGKVLTSDASGLASWQSGGTGGSPVYSCPDEWWYGYNHTCASSCSGQLQLGSTCRFATGDGCNGITIRNCTTAGHLVP